MLPLPFHSSIRQKLEMLSAPLDDFDHNVAIALGDPWLDSTLWGVVDLNAAERTGVDASTLFAGFETFHIFVHGCSSLSLSTWLSKSRAHRR